MSREISKEAGLDVIREEHSAAVSAADMESKSPKSSENEINIKECCRDKILGSSGLKERQPSENKFSPKDVEELLKKKEEELTELYEKRLDREIYMLKDRCDYILLNEQIRASHMLREAHRERQEKISALQTQLECKNMAALMYVLCTERRKTKLEKLRIIEAYTNYITGLENILVEAQDLILHLSRGYKTAARVDYEWKEKMRNVLKEFTTFIYDFAGGTPETNQYFFNIPELLKIEASLEDDPAEDPCDCLCYAGENDEEPCTCDDYVPEGELASEQEKEWWERIDEQCRPFIMFGDMETFKPPQRREVLRKVKAAKTAPRKWKEYAFHEMFLKSNCPHADEIKDIYPDRIPVPNWECSLESNNDVHVNTNNRNASKMSFSAHPRQTALSVDLRAGMGSILKIMTTTHIQPPQENKANILGARDSIEITSGQKLRRDSRRNTEPKVEVLDINANRRASAYTADIDMNDDIPNERTHFKDVSTNSTKADEDEKKDTESILGSVVDSLQMQSHQPEPDHKIHYEKVCPVEKCNRMQMDDFMRSLPPYMRANPFTHFEQTFDQYETCSPEQLEILKSRIEQKKMVEKSRVQMHEPGILDEWEAIPGVAVQTSELSLSLPPCLCRVPSPSPVSSAGRIYDLSELEPVKAALDNIHEACFYDSRIQFDRFKVIGEGSEDSLPKKPKDIGRARLQEITKVLKVHPSLLDIFQANQQ